MLMTAISILFALLIGAAYVGYAGLPVTGDVTMGIGIIFTIVVGFIIVVGGGLMALMFYSRHGYDGPPSKPAR
jgi:hypothetical protein